MILIDSEGGRHEVEGSPDAVEEHALAAATGWVLKPEGLCRGDVCVRIDRNLRGTDGLRVLLAPWSEALGLLVVAAPEDDVVALVHAASRVASPDGRAPELTLPDLDGNPVSFDDQSGHKRVLVTWASWCGCRHELAGWERLHQELRDAGLRLFSVALDADPEDSRPWIEAGAPTYPVTVDTAHVTAERYGIRNVPSVVWVDELDRIVKPATIAPGDDQFVDFTRIQSARHHDALRAWVAEGTLPESAATSPPPRTDAEQRALGERRIAAVLVGAGLPERARVHLAAAQELAPWDWTVRRGGIAMTGGDPFLGEDFLAFWQQWDDAGRPGYTPT